MKRLILLCLSLVMVGQVWAEDPIKVSYQQQPLPEVLSDIEQRFGSETSINFSYDKLEDYLITTTVDADTPWDAIRQVIGFYPIKMSRLGNQIFVQPMRDTKAKIVGRLINEQGEGIDFADLAAYTLLDTVYLASAVTTESGDFVLPVSQDGDVLLQIHRIGYRSVMERVHVGDVGSIQIASNPEMLDDVVVQAQTVIRPVRYGIAVIPTERERSRSANVWQLLSRLMMPGLVIDPVTRKVQTTSQESVVYFINGVKAAEWEVKALSPKQIVKIEYLLSPPDPQFEQQPYVLHFILKDVAYGGYAVTDISQGFKNNNGDYTVTAKVNRGKVTHAAIGEVAYRDANDIQNEEVNTYCFTENNLLTRIDKQQGEMNTQDYTGTYMARYDGTHLLLQGTGGFRYSRTSKYHLDRQLTYIQQGEERLVSGSSDNTSESYLPYAKFYWKWSGMPRKSTLSGTASVSYNHNQASSFYQTDEQITPLLNATQEDAWFPRVSMDYQIPLYRENQLTLRGDFQGECYQTDYTGTNISHQRLLNHTLILRATYSHTFSPLWHGSLSFEVPLNRYRINTLNTVSRTYFNASFRFNGMLKEKHSFNGYLVMQQMPLYPSYYNTVVRQDSELEGAQGTTILQTPHFFSGQLSHMWMPSSVFSLSTAVHSYGVIDDLVPDWHPVDGLMIRTMVNSGNYATYGVTVTPGLSFLNRKLRFQAYCYYAHEIHGGLYDLSLDNCILIPSVGMDVNERLSFSLNMYKSWGKAYLRGGTGNNVAMADPGHLSLSATYQVGNLFLSATGYTPMWKKGTRSRLLMNPYVTSYTCQSYPWENRYVSVSLRYTFSFGRKVSHDNDLRYQGTVKSSVLD